MKNQQYKLIARYDAGSRFIELCPWPITVDVVSDGASFEVREYCGGQCRVVSYHPTKDAAVDAARRHRG